MRPILTFIIVFLTLNCFSQKNDTSIAHISKSDVVSFVTKLNIGNLTKDGIYLNGYVVKISYDQAR